jgi:hypothetical protein
MEQDLKLVLTQRRQLESLRSKVARGGTFASNIAPKNGMMSGGPYGSLKDAAAAGGSWNAGGGGISSEQAIIFENKGVDQRITQKMRDKFALEQARKGGSK